MRWFAVLMFCAQAACTTSDDEIAAFLTRYESALASRSFDAVEPLLHSQAVFRFSEGDFTTPETIRAAFERTFSVETADTRYVLKDKRVVNADVDQATVIFRWHWSGTAPTGDPFEIVGRGTLVLAREAGELRVLLEHLSR